MPTQIQLRRDTAADWTSNNPTLAQGEFGWESDTNRFKIGDGSSNWQSLAYASDGDTAGITFVGDDSSGTTVSQNETFKIAGTQNISAAVSGDTLTLTGPDLSTYLTASSSTTLTNKSIDADNNTISNIEVDNLKSGVLDTDISSVAGTDTTLASAKAIKTYVDAQIQTKDNTDEITEGSSNLYYTDARAQAVSINNLSEDTTPQLGGNLDLNGNDIVTTSNADIELAANGTGKVLVKGNTNPGTIVLNCESNSHGQTIKSQPHSASVTNTLTLPAGGDQEIVGTAATQTFTNKTFDAEGTGNALSNVDVANLKSGVLDTDISSVSGSDDTIASAKAIKTYVDAQIATKDNSDEITEGSTNLYFTNARADARITNALKDEDTMSSDSATHVPSQQSVKAYVDAQDAAIASDTLTLTNKTIDANGTGNSITNLEVADLASGVLDTDISSVSASDNTIASAKAIKTYVDAQIATKDALSELSGDTDDVSEGSSNLYFTNARADARITNALVDEDNMSSNSATQIPSQQSVKAYVDAEVAGVVDSAPSALNTLNELAAALGDDSNFATTTSTSLGNRLRIDVNNQGLTSTQKTNAATNLGLNTVATSGAYSDLSGTPTIPSNNNQLTNGAGFITDSNITVVGDDSSGVTFSTKNNDNLKIAGGTNITTAVSGDTVTITGPDTSGFITASSTTTLTNKTFDVEGTGNSISNIDVADLKSGVLDTDISSVSGSDDTIASAKAIKTYVDAQIATKDNSDEITEGSTNLYFTNARADARITNALKDEDNFASDSATHVPSQQSVKAYVDAQDANIASDTLTFTNKTFDVEATGNSISNIDVADLKSGVLDTDISSVAGTDTTLASAKAIKTYVDAQIATKDNSDEITEGSSNLYFTNTRADARITAALIDEDDMSSNSATRLPSQQSVKAYVDAGDLSLIDEDNFSTDSATRPPSQQSVKAYIATQIATKDNTDEITEGSSNLYYTDARAQAVSINNLSEDSSPQLGGDLDVNGQDIVTTSNANIELAPNGTGKTVLKGNTNPGTLIFNCENNSHGQTVIAQPHSASVTNTLTLPAGGDQEIVGTTATQTFTNKTLTSPVLNTGVSGTAILDEDNMASNSATQLATQQSIKAYVDSEVSGSGGGAANAFKTISVSGQDDVVADSATDTLTLVAGSNMTITTSASGDTITLAASGGGSGITVQEEGSSLSTAGTTLNFVGSGVTASGTGATKTITISGGGGGSTGDLAITGSTISSPSNGDLTLETSGTGGIVLNPAGTFADYREDGYMSAATTATRNAGMTRIADYKEQTNGERAYRNNSMYIKLTGSDSSSSNCRWRNQFNAQVDQNGLDSTNTGTSRGIGHFFNTATLNTSSHGVQVGTHNGISLWSEVGGYSTDLQNGDITQTNQFGGRFAIVQSAPSGKTTTVTNAYGMHVRGSTDGSGTKNLTNEYLFYADKGGITPSGENYNFYSEDESANERFGAIKKFNEGAYTASHSGNGTYTVDFDNGNLQIVTLGANITSFTMSNFPTSTTQSVGVTLYLVQDGTGSRTMTFSPGSSETFKFANGANSSSVSSANDIQTVYIFSRYNGSSNTYYWTLGPVYS